MAEKFADFVARTRPQLLARAILFSGGDVHAAEDAVQDAYLAAERYWSRIGTYESPEGWVAKVIWQRLVKYRRGLLRRSTALQKLSPRSLHQPDPVQVEWLHAVLAQIDRLPAQRRQMLIMRSLGGMTYEEIATLLDKSPKTVENTLIAARRQLRDRLGMPAFVNDPGAYAVPDAAPDQLTVMLQRVETTLCELLAAGGPAW